MIKSAKDFWCGMMFICFGLVAFIMSKEYGLGEFPEMGPGLLPRALGLILLVIGAIGLFRSFTFDGDAFGHWAVKETLVITLSIIVFALTVRGLGLVTSIIILVMLVGTASGEFKARSYFILALAIAVFSSLVFVLGIGLPIELVGPWVQIWK